ncbi:hypothetical protein SJS82_18670 [Aeromonas media]|uniref:Uncharacterized protein n=1 Tax=Aeromonas media TaxID=651 RepID=A0AAP6GF40_AERME|nr:hypothetical protein [Aeromonas media]MDX7923953.1 hypothetical protein [Aeromonas media]
MNRTTTLLLSLLLVAGTSTSSAQAQAQEQGDQTFSVDALTFKLDWNDTQFDWSQTGCLDLGVGEESSPDCKGTKLNLDDETPRNQPPSSNQVPTSQEE